MGMIKDASCLFHYGEALCLAPYHETTLKPTEETIVSAWGMGKGKVKMSGIMYLGCSPTATFRPA